MDPHIHSAAAQTDIQRGIGFMERTGYGADKVLLVPRRSFESSIIKPLIISRVTKDN